MLPSLLATALLFALVGIGLGWPLVARQNLAAAEKLVAGVALSLLTAFLIAWTIYVAALPIALTWSLPLLALAGILVRWPELRAAFRDPAARAIFAAQCLVTAGVLGWLATIASYSGGGWAGDWIEHWQRARFFIDRGPLDTKFIVIYALTARPPLANVFSAALLDITRVDFAHYQVVTALLSAVAFLPAALLALRWGGIRAVAVLAVLALVNPFFLQNATFPWTKLPAAFFVLTAVYFFLRTQDVSAPASAPLLCAASLAAAMLTHYSAGPYCVVLAAAWLFLSGKKVHAAAWWKTTATMAVVGGGLLATWFAWAFVTYGVSGTLLTNSSVTAADARLGDQLLKIILNLFDTLVPHFLRPLDTGLIAQLSRWGRLRDWFFQCYQVNLPLAFGSIAWLVISWELWRAARTADGRARRFWIFFIAGIVVLGTASHGARDHWGLAHICLHALILIGLAFLASRWASLSRPWRIALVAGGAIDFVFGIVLHFGVQSFSTVRWFSPGEMLQQSFDASAMAARMNLLAKVQARMVFVTDLLSPPFAIILIVVALLLVLALLRAKASP